MKRMWDSRGGFYSVDVQTAHEFAWEAEEPWRVHWTLFEFLLSVGLTPLTGGTRTAGL